MMLPFLLFCQSSLLFQRLRIWLVLLYLTPNKTEKRENSNANMLVLTN